VKLKLDYYLQVLLGLLYWFSLCIRCLISLELYRKNNEKICITSNMHLIRLFGLFIFHNAFLNLRVFMQVSNSLKKFDGINLLFYQF